VVARARPAEPVRAVARPAGLRADPLAEAVVAPAAVRAEAVPAEEAVVAAEAEASPHDQATDLRLAEASRFRFCSRARRGGSRGLARGPFGIAVPTKPCVMTFGSKNGAGAAPAGDEMFKERTVIVVGAGAGVDYQMPLGSKLVSDIAADVRFSFGRMGPFEPVTGNAALFRLLNRRFEGDRSILSAYAHAGNALASVLSSAISVDDALYQLSETQEAVVLGKLCIVRKILEAEAASTIRNADNGRPHNGSGRDGWIEQLFSMATSGVRQSEMEFAFDKVTFVIFNYDRCVEHYLYWAFQRIGIDEGRSANIVRQLKIIRPYGAIGSILRDDADFVAYGGETDPFRAISRIRTYTESDAIHDGATLVQAILTARMVMFLGFGFHAQNMELLKAPELGYRHVMATVKKVHDGNKQAISNEIIRNLRCQEPDRVALFNMTAPEMLRELRPRIQLTVG